MSPSRLLLLSLLSLSATAQNAPFSYPPAFPDAKVELFKTIGDTKLNLYIFNPPEIARAGNRPAIVFFFGGGWQSGSPAQFEHQCRHIASLGMVAIAADYRVSNRNHSTVLDSIHDAKSAIRYVRQNAARLGIDPERIAAAGGSSGGHLAAATGIISGLDEPAGNAAISSRPNALVLFNPVVLLAPVEGDEQLTRASLKTDVRKEFAGVDAVSVSPWHHVAKNDPPTIIFHGKGDTTVPYASVAAFAKKMQAAGNRCELVGFEGQTHGFFNYHPGGNKFYDETLRGAEEFLASLGYLKIK